ncbi:MogA/MoaB family molybdenum cofactor biosynthesis protein [bacterium]|nr:MogA/MoaB family molybdenum cofactor biosynthesis protein [bacterium]
MAVRFAVLTVSDRSSRGEREDLAGPLLIELLTDAGHSCLPLRVVPDEITDITAQMIAWCDSDMVDVVLTTGGTGFAPRDVTPEATSAVVQRPAPGIAEAARAFSLKITPHAMLSRNNAGIRGQTLIINLPGSPKAAREILEYLLPVLPHAVELMKDEPNAEQSHNQVARQP